MNAHEQKITLAQIDTRPVGNGFNVRLKFTDRTSHMVHLQKTRTPEECASHLRALANEVELHYQYAGNPGEEHY